MSGISNTTGPESLSTSAGAWTPAHRWTERQQEIAGSDADFRRLVLDLLPKLAYAYLVEGTADRSNPHYQSAEILQLYIAGLEHAYSRGVTEQAWLPDHAGTASADAVESGLARPAGDVSTLSLRLGGIRPEHLPDARAPRSCGSARQVSGCASQSRHQQRHDVSRFLPVRPRGSRHPILNSAA